MTARTPIGDLRFEGDPEDGPDALPWPADDAPQITPTPLLYMTTVEVSERLRVPVRTLDRWASDGTGPPFTRIGGRRRYPTRDLQTWIDAQPKGGQR